MNRLVNSLLNGVETSDIIPAPVGALADCLVNATLPTNTAEADSCDCSTQGECRSGCEPYGTYYRRVAEECVEDESGQVCIYGSWENTGICC